MVVAGCRPESNRIGVRIATVIGNAPKTAGIGPAMNHGAGQLIIMGVGIFTRDLGGIGFLRLNGLQPGSAGGEARAMLVGRR